MHRLIRPPQVVFAVLVALIAGGCATILPRTVNEGPASRVFADVPGIMAGWVADQNALVGGSSANIPFPGWGAAEVVASSEKRVTIRLQRKWALTTRTEYQKNIDDAFITATPSGYSTKVSVAVFTRPALANQRLGSGNRDRAKGNQVLLRALSLLGERN